jgi:hypothetical protein
VPHLCLCIIKSFHSDRELGGDCELVTDLHPGMKDTDAGCPVPPLQTTPIKLGTSTLWKFTTNHKYREKEMADMGKEMKGYIVGPMPVTEFLDEFFPGIPLKNDAAQQYEKGCFDTVVCCTGETQAYDPFVGLFIPITRCCK